MMDFGVGEGGGGRGGFVCSDWLKLLSQNCKVVSCLWFDTLNHWVPFLGNYCGSEVCAVFVVVQFFLFGHIFWSVFAR